MGACVEEGCIMMDVKLDECWKQIQVLSETLWENRAMGNKVEKWLENFKEEEEKKWALFLLSKLMYFNSSNIRLLLKNLYENLFRYPLIKKIRLNLDGCIDEDKIEESYKKCLKKTCFLGVGNPSESGVHLLYYFRQENKIPKDLFVYTDDVIILENDKQVINPKYINRDFVFIDDLCGSGSQATSKNSNIKRCVEHIRALSPKSRISYFVLFGTTEGLNVVKNAKNSNNEFLFDCAEAVVEFDNSYKCFSDESRYFKNPLNRDSAKKMALKYGFDLAKQIAICEEFPNPDKYAQRHALGFKDCQLLLSMHHNTPNNTLPIIWFDEDERFWFPIFKRYNKVYKEL